MELQAAQNLAMRLMKEHGVTDDGWRFEWSRGKKTLGQASAKRNQTTGTLYNKRIKLSYYHAALNDEDTVRGTILHEIAHALAGIHNKHNHVWRAWCRRVGAEPKQYDTTSNVPAPKYLTVCPVHGTLSKNYRRRTTLHRVFCRKCGESSLGLLRQVRA
tara:strand:- start:1381 stop:1857 length:477 start_codon:yes stop_codon:yes gene_type:complete